MAEAEGVDIRNYRIIYDLVDDVEKALKGMLEPEYVEVIDGHAEVREIFFGGKRVGLPGLMSRWQDKTRAPVRIKRGGKVLAESVVNSLRRFKDDVKEVAAGYECGIALQDFDKFQMVIFLNAIAGRRLNRR